MCGIAGVLSFDGDPARVSRRRLHAMARALAHRGPDGEGFFIDTARHEVGLAHTRLSVVDLTGGQQPIGNEDGSIQVVFNGEIFNYIELRDELVRKGHRFRTASDTEVLVHLYEEEGDDFVHQLNGQFAIALWDGRRRRLVLVRDRPGILPVYYLQTRSELVFGSEIKALLAVSSRPRVNAEALRQVMTLWAPLSPDTLFEGIVEVEPGQIVTVADGRLQKRYYWRWDLPPEGEGRVGPDGELADELVSLLDDATRIRLRADVPVGAYLSGGLDSSVLTGLVARTAGTRLRTFSIGFEDREFDETAHQQEMIAFIGADHSRVSMSRRDVAAGFPDVIRSAETPITRTAPVPMARLSAHVRASGYKVVLTGEGADEVLGGYDLFKETKIRAFCARHPGSRMRPLLLKRLYPYLTFTRGQPVAVLKSYFASLDDDHRMPGFSHRTRFLAGARCEAFLSPGFRAQFGAACPEQQLLDRLGEGLAGRCVFHRAQLLEARTLMAGYLLSSQGDRMLMAHSVEGRFPYLDHRVIEFGNALDPRLKMKVLNEKYLLKKGAAPLVPKAIVTRAKQPYRAPDAIAFLGPDRPAYVGDLLAASTLTAYGYFDAAKVGRLVRKLEDAARHDRPITHVDSLAFVTILSTQLWHRLFQDTTWKS
jgi:asparagine synthase (glutamine-hydrolysing)